jgi:anti-sigma regulatory factor (Ser/Thr protein kinase)
MASLRVGASLDALSEIGAFVMREAEQAGIERKAAYRLRLAVDEIATNIVLHGKPDEGANEMVDVLSTIDDDSLTIVLEDCGPAFDPLTHELPDADDLSKPMHEKPMGGLGVFLAIRGVDQFRYERMANGNRNVFIVNRKPRAAAAGA